MTTGRINQVTIKAVVAEQQLLLNEERCYFSDQGKSHEATTPSRFSFHKSWFYHRDRSQDSSSTVKTVKGVRLEVSSPQRIFK